MIGVGILAVVSYLSGAIPFSYIAGKLFGGIDLREHGSGNLGASNTFRFLGPSGPADRQSQPVDPGPGVRCSRLMARGSMMKTGPYDLGMADHTIRGVPRGYGSRDKKIW